MFSTETEKEVALYFDLSQKKFTLEPTSNGFAFNLRLDRIDRHRQKKYAVIYDYKSSGYAVKKSDKWLDEKQFQMLLYITALKLTAP
ncbi:MAG: PD-(D/E)XK nuclease family protein, partial [Bdellovibrionaceae bacterium]|nr:PD-(D/E)XK nuclease family protein [Pseudobdellovibrionaceae bacterium]